MKTHRVELWIVARLWIHAANPARPVAQLGTASVAPICAKHTVTATRQRQGESPCLQSAPQDPPHPRTVKHKHTHANYCTHTYTHTVVISASTALQCAAFSR